MATVSQDYPFPLPVVSITPALLAAMLAKEVADGTAKNTAYTTAVGEQFTYTYSRTLGTSKQAPLS